METTTSTFTNLGNFNATYGPLKQYYTGTIRNLGARFREELEFVPKWTLAAGMGFEQSILSVSATNYTNGLPSSYVNVNNTYYNYAPELSLTWKPADGYRHWARASTGYGIPTFSNLLTGLNGQPGANTSVKPEKNLNLELGTEDKITQTLSLHVVGFFVYFHNEIISQTPAANLSSYAINANWSEFYGVEAGYTWRPTEEWRLTGAYTHLYSSYISFTDQYIQNGVVTQVNQAGRQVPNVPSDILNLKEAYDHPTNGWGGWVETSYYNSYFLNNGNTVGIPSYWLWNLNVHKEFAFTNNPWFRFAKFYVELDNVANKHYAASGAVISDGTPDSQKQLFYAGYGRAIYGGVTLGLF